MRQALRADGDKLDASIIECLSILVQGVEQQRRDSPAHRVKWDVHVALRPLEATGALKLKEVEYMHGVYVWTGDWLLTYEDCLGNSSLSLSDFIGCAWGAHYGQRPGLERRDSLYASVQHV